nr:peptidase S10, serine carboxypeptidase, alpha/beta hydrolase fold protein [Tanacetum cinerariifolium]
MQIPLIIIVLILQPPFSHCKSIVKNLPRFSGDLPFTLETGYVGVGKRKQVQLFYYFVESQRNPQKDPLLLYLTGGPGTSGIIPFLYQIGPLNFVYTNATRTDVKLELNPYSWTKTANVIFIDLPVGTGFSYVKANESLKNSDSLAATHAYDFIRKWLMDHPKFLNNPLYITGISYMGLFIPKVISNVYDGNDRGVRPKMNIKGLMIVNPLTDKFIDFNSRTEFAYRAALIEYELYKPAKENCGGKYINVDPNNTLCLNSLKPINESLSRVKVPQILEPICDAQDPKAICRVNHKRSHGTVENFQFTNTSIAAVSSYARVMIELQVDVELKDNIVMDMPKITRDGHYTCNVYVEYEWKPSRCSSCKVFGHIHEECSKNTGTCKKKIVKSLAKLLKVDNDVEFSTNENTTNLVNNRATSSGSSFMNIDNDEEFVSNTPIGEKINKIERQICEGELRLLDNDGNSLVLMGIV